MDHQRVVTHRKRRFAIVVDILGMQDENHDRHINLLVRAYEHPVDPHQAATHAVAGLTTPVNPHVRACALLGPTDPASGRRLRACCSSTSW